MMDLRVLLGLVLALACAAGASLSGLWKAKGVVQTQDVDIRRPVRSAAALFRSKWFVIGWIAAAIAWLLHVGALALAPLSLGQAVIAGGLVSLGLVAERFFGFRLHRRQWLGLLVIAFGMAALAITAHSERNDSSFGIPEIVTFELAAIVIGVGCVMTYRLKRLRDKHGVLLGVAAGTLFGVSDIDQWPGVAIRSSQGSRPPGTRADDRGSWRSSVRRRRTGPAFVATHREMGAATTSSHAATACNTSELMVARPEINELLHDVGPAAMT